MKKATIKDIATSFTTTIFIVIATTGVMMYFHILDKYTKNLHEIIGLGFVVFAILHVFVNWKSMKSYFSKKIFLLSFIVVGMISVGFIINTPTGENPKTTIIKSVLTAPIEDAVNILGVDMDLFELRLKIANIKFDNEVSISQIAKVNKISPFKDN